MGLSMVEVIKTVREQTKFKVDMRVGELFFSKLIFLIKIEFVFF